MKYVKMLGLAAVAAMALMAFVGAGSASATALCSTTPTTSGSNIGECPEGWTIDEFEASLSKNAKGEQTATLETLGGTILDTCTVGTVAGAGNGTGSTTETVSGEITALTWGTKANPCTKTTETIKTGSLEIHAIGDTHNGTLTASDGEVTVLTVLGTCVYGVEKNKDLGELVGGNPATLAINTIVTKQSGNAACPTETRWTANYSVTSGPLWVATGIEP